MHALSLSLSQLISFIPTKNRGFMHFRTLTTFMYRGELSYIVSLRHIYPPARSFKIRDNKTSGSAIFIQPIKPTCYS